MLGHGRRDPGEWPLAVPELGAWGTAALLSLPSSPSLTQILVGCADRTVKHFSTEDGIFQGQRHCPGGEGIFRGLAQTDG